MDECVRIKIISKNGISDFQLFDLPQQHAGRIEWVTDIEARDYDWLVVYDDLPPKGGERLTLRVEELACPQSQTVLITYEPSSVKYFGSDYVNQYGMLMTSQNERDLPHRNRVDCPPIGAWFYGGVKEMQGLPVPPEKTGMISMFGSPKAQKHTLHHRRAEFLSELAEALADSVDVYGRGYRSVEHKAEGIDDYRYHIAVENHIGPHHWTEKLSDAFLGYSLPFYVGCTNAADYFPEDSFIAIDIRDTAKAVATIKQAIADNEYEKRLPAIVEARRRVIEDYNLGNLIAKHILENHPVDVPNGLRKILSRHAMQRRDIPTLLRYAWGKTSARRFHRKYWRDYLAGK